EFIHGRPRTPMGMRALVSALVEIGAPGLAGNSAEVADVMREDRERNEESQEPHCRVGNLGIDLSWKRGRCFDVLTDGRRQSCELFEAARDTLRINDVRAKESSAAVEFEIEVAMIGFGLNKEFDAAVLPNRVKISRPFAQDVTILDTEQTVNAGFFVE